MGGSRREPVEGEARGPERWHRVLPVGIGIAMALWIFSAAWVSGSYPLVDPDEGRNAVVAREIATGGSWLLPSYEGLPYLDKPLLWFDAAALSMRLLGPTEQAARAPSLLFTALTVLVVWFAARHFYGRRRGLVAALALAASPLVIVYAHVAIFDAMLTFFVVSALLAFWLAVRSGEPGAPDEFAPAPIWSALAWVAIALGTLTKGPVAILVPLLVAVPYGLFRRRLRRILSPRGILLFFLLVLPWAIYVELQVPGFLRYALVTESWRRITTDSFNREGPVWYFVPYLVIGALPWFVGAMAGWWRSGRRLAARGDALFPLLWIALPFVFFSLSQSKRPHYVLPLLAAVALLFAYNFDDTDRQRRAARAAALVTGAFGLLLLGASFVPTSSWSMPEHIADPFAPTVRMLGLWFIALGIAALALARRRGMAAAGVVAVAFWGIPILGQPLVRAAATERSTAHMAEAIRRHCPDTEVVAVRFLPLSLPFYLEAPIVVSTDDRRALPGSFLQFSWERYRHDPVVRPSDYWRRMLQSGEPAVLIFDVDHLEYRLAEQRGARQLYANYYWRAYGNCRAVHPSLSGGSKP